MGDIFAAIEARHKEVRAELKSITVPEWDNSVIYYYANPTTADALKILKHYDQAAGGFDMEGLVTALMVCALDEDGARLFKPVQRSQLMAQTEMGVLLRIVNEMNVLDAIVNGDTESNGDAGSKK